MSGGVEHLLQNFGGTEVKLLNRMPLHGQGQGNELGKMSILVALA